MGVRSVDFKERGIEGCLGRGTTGTTDNVITSVNGEMRAIAGRSGDHHFMPNGTGGMKVGVGIGSYPPARIEHEVSWEEVPQPCDVHWSRRGPQTQR